MSVQIRLNEQVLKVDDSREPIEAIVHKYDAFLNLLSGAGYEFQRDAIREALRFLVSDKYPDLERLARENWGARPPIQQRHDNIDAYLGKMPLKDRKSVSIDLATGTGKSYVMYGLAAIALAEGLVDRVLVLCPSLTIEEELLVKFSALAGNGKMSAIMKGLGAAMVIPAIKRGNETIQAGDICIENIHAVYESTGSSIRDSFKGNGGRTLALNDEAHHIFNLPDKGTKKWLEFLQDAEFGFTRIVNVTGTPYVQDDYFPDIVFRYGLKQAIEDKVVKKPDYKLYETFTDKGWQETYAIHQKNQTEYGGQVRPISIVVTQEIARCVEVWRELVDYLAAEEGIPVSEAEKKAIWVTSSVPDKKSKAGKRVLAVYGPRDDKDSPEKRRLENLSALKTADEADSPVEWIVSVSMLTEGWDVKNVFQIVPHESRAFSSKLLIAQVLGRGLRVPPGLSKEPLVTINNHEAWSGEIGDLLKDVLEVENTLSWGYDPRRSKYVFPLHNLRYEIKQETVETKRKRAKEPDVKFQPQNRITIEHSTFSETGDLAVEIEHHGLLEIEDAVKRMRLFIREKDTKIAKIWTKKKIEEFIVSNLKDAGHDQTFLSKENLLLLQYAFSPMFRVLGKEHPRLTRTAKELVKVDIKEISQQSFSESSLKEHGALFTVNGDKNSFKGHEANLWRQYQKWLKIAEIDETGLSEDVKNITRSINKVRKNTFKSPWNVQYVTHKPELEFSKLLFAESKLFDSLIKMPDKGGYTFPYSYKPSKSGKTHTVNENFNPDFFLRVAGSNDILVVEIKADDDDTNRNRAKCRDGLIHFKNLNEKLKKAKEKWRYHFFFLSPADYTSFFEQVRTNSYEGWKSGLMQDLS